MVEAALSPINAAAILIVVAALLAYLNHVLFRLPSSVGLTIMGALASLVVVALDRLMPGSTLAEQVTGFITGIDFHVALMDGMLSFLLFAGALHVDWSEMKRSKWPILLLSTVGVLLSTGLVGAAIWAGSAWLGVPLPFIWCLVFGALISPTDPVSVMSTLKRARVAPTLEATVAGESLFNDGVGVVVFAILLTAALSGADLSFGEATALFAQEAIGGVLLGLAIGWVAFRMMRSIDEYKVEVLISLAVVMGGYAFAHAVHVSGPVAMAVAGLLIGNHGVNYAMSDVTRDYLHKFWAIIDDILNSVLFLLIGLEVVAISTDPKVLALGILAVPIALGARMVSVLLLLKLIGPLHDINRVGRVTLIWGGLRGGISIALALGLGMAPDRTILVTVTYLVVLFSVIIQGGTIERALVWAARTDPGQRSDIDTPSAAATRR